MAASGVPTNARNQMRRNSVPKLDEIQNNLLRVEPNAATSLLS